MKMVKPARKFSLWILVFAVTSALQVFRGDPLDEIVFISGTGVLVLAALSNYNIPAGKRFHRYTQIARYLALALVVALTLLPRHSIGVLVVLIAILPLMLIAAWVGTYSGSEPHSKRVKRTRAIWIVWAVLFCLWEFLANILGQLAGDLQMYPTISFLLNPFLDKIMGRVVFVALWLWGGYTLLFRLREPKE